MKSQTLDEVRERLNATLREKKRASGALNIADDLHIQQIDGRTVRILVLCTDGTQFTVDFDPLAAVTLADSDLLLHVDCGGVAH